MEGCVDEHEKPNGDNTVTGCANVNDARSLLSTILALLMSQNTNEESLFVVCDTADLKVRLETDLYNIIQKSKCTVDDIEVFSKALNHLVNNCGYGLNDANPSLLLSAALNNNMPIVLKLLLDHNAPYNDTTPDIRETILHIACRLDSPLRYIYVLVYPSLLSIPDSYGNLPIHIACQNNDIQFISWIFKSVLCKGAYPSTGIKYPLIGMTESIGAKLDSDFTPPFLSIKFSKLSATTTTGQSVYHIAMSNGYCQLLSLLLNILELMQEEFEMDIAFTPDFDTRQTPLDIAIMQKQIECLRILLEFLNKHNMLQKVVQDGRFVKCAANVGDASIMKLLVKYGFSQGLEEAIGKVQDQQLKRLLLYYYTQLTSAKAIMETEPDYRKGLTKGQIKWNGATIETLDFICINDSFSAMKSISRAISESEEKQSLHDLCTLQHLASECLSYFESDPLLSSQLSMNPLIPITEIDITYCSLKSVPPELFQLHTLEVLKLSDNCIQELPTALHSSQCIYSPQSLKKLVLDGNKLKTLPEDLFLGLVNSLEHLSVQKNELTELPPGLWVMPHLKELNLSENNLSQLHYLCDRTSIDDPNFSERILLALDEHNAFLHKYNSCSTEAAFVQDSAEYHDEWKYLQRLCVFCKTLDKATGGKFVTRDFIEWVQLLHKQQLQRENCGELSAMPYVCFNEEIVPSALTSLGLSHNMFITVPKELPCLATNLERLNMSYNQIKHLNLVRSLPSNIISVQLDHNLIEDIAASMPGPTLCYSPYMLLQMKPLDCCSHTTHNQLKSLANLSLGYNKLKDFKAIDLCACTNIDIESIAVYSAVVHFPQLSVLSLEHNELTSVPPSILNLSSLNSLNLAHNTGIVSLPSRLGLLPLYILDLEGLSLAGLPINLVEKLSSKHLISYLRGIVTGAEYYRHMKLMLVGSANAGKTTLLLQLTKKGKMARQRTVQVGVNGLPLSTVGVELGQWEYSRKRSLPKITFTTWDYGGQEEYYATHQCFISHRSLYLVVWDAREGEAGLRNIKTWLENIEARAHNAPVIVVGTHADCIKNTSALGEAFKRLYVECNPSSFAYPKIQPHCFFVDSFNSSDVQQLRGYIYEFTRLYRIPAARKDAPPLLEEPIPSYYMAVLKIIQTIATMCNKRKTIPIFSRNEYLKEVYQCGYAGNTQEIVEASSFWHDNGIILHHKGITMDELYCVDPQWLCATMANVITVQQRNPFQKNGFMHIEDFVKLFNVDCTQSFINGIISIMQSFEVILLLDQQSILIPSLISQQRKNACAISQESCGHLTMQSTVDRFAAPITTQKDVLIRHYILPFVPNGFFSRLISRVCASPLIIAQCKGVFGGQDAWWSCWKDGICLICNDIEVLSIVPVTYPFPGTDSTYIVTSEGHVPVNWHSGIEVRACPILASHDVGLTSDPNDDMRAATWLLEQAIECIDSIFDDWYVSFGRKRGFELSTILLGVPCDRCEAERLADACPAIWRRLASNNYDTGKSGQERVTERTYFLFTSSFCALTVAKKQEPQCPRHGRVNVFKVAPDLVFRDLPQSMIYSAGNIAVASLLGKGGYGAVYSGTIKTNAQRVGIKMFMGMEDSFVLSEPVAWEMYQQASREVRVLRRLVHDNILGLVGVAVAPLMLLLELAPLGDLKACVERFQKVNVKLNVWTLTSTLIQVAKAMELIHLQKIIFRDLKPGNILVWKFPLPETQWNSDSEVYVKLADYGICQQYTPQGVRGGDGTPPYLPPEVLLHGGQQSHSTKLDVYSFGMLMYYLFTFENPFQNETRPISSLLDEGKRPSLSFKQCPPSLWLLELMCWCWSEHPYHRPDIKEVLTVLEDGVTSQLVSAFPISSTDVGMVAACTRWTLKGHSFSTTVSLEKQHTVAAPGYLSPLSHINDMGKMPMKSSSLEIWCASEVGLKCISCHAAGCTVEDVEPPEGECLSMVCTPNDQVWVSTALPTGGQLNIYDARTHYKTATWCSKDAVRKLLYNSAEDIVVGITDKELHIFVFSDCTDELKPMLTQPITESFTEAVLVGAKRKDYKINLWYSVASRLKAITLSACGITSETFRQGESSIVEHMAPLEEAAEGHRLKHLVLSHRACIEKWDVDQMERSAICDCYDLCSNLCDKDYENCKVTSLLHWKDVLYVGTEGGVLLALNPGDLTALWTVNAAETPIRYLVGAILDPHVQSDSLPHSCRGHSRVPGLVISFGERYTGVFKGSNNVPPSLNPPGEQDGSPSSSPRLKLFTTPSCSTHLFMWSPLN